MDVCLFRQNRQKILNNHYMGDAKGHPLYYDVGGKNPGYETYGEFLDYTKKELQNSSSKAASTRIELVFPP